MVQDSKSNDQRFWSRWSESGAVGNIKTAYAEQARQNRGLDSSKRAIPMLSIADRLRNLREYMPHEQQVVYDFGNYLAGRLNPSLVPEGFNMAATLALYDLQKGVDGFTGKPINSSLVGYPPQIYSILNIILPQIADAVCPKDFAGGVRAFSEDVTKKIKRDRHIERKVYQA
ncbi:MAG TPA: hypothetical protein VJH92_04310 [Candidatus Nanoarchaeia archaeon]|nr:hypothetical protein [Candidatus Nanoarchaeia archaeon]